MAALVAAFALGGCASDESAPAPDEGLVGPPRILAPEIAAAPSPAEADNDPAADSSLALGDQEEETPALTPEDFEEGFCVDDIYAKYLISHYDAKGDAHPRRTYAEEGGKRHGKHRRKRRDKYEQHLREFAALAHAKNVMSGRTTSYFGAIPIVVNDKVDFWVQYFKTSGRELFMRWLVRGETMKRTVQPILQEGGVPTEFFYLAMIESGLSSSAYSRAAATGTWQFMRGTAKLYGLKIDHWVDERRDPVKSTMAAANFLKDLYADLGDWHLAMAAYNAGPGKVHKAIRQGGNADFWRLSDTPYLAKETKQYVPKVLAAVLLASEAKAHGFDVRPDAMDGLPETEVIVKRPVKLDDLARHLGLSVKTLSRWNPELIHNVTPPVKTGYALRLPTYYANLFPTIEGKLTALAIRDVQMHTVRKGETLSRIARKYKVAVKAILAVNPDLVAGKLKPGRTIAIPVPGVVEAATNRTQL
jgi:membrane-bound lytic murein transglycosylase D